jgi:hypothetical protein
MNRLFASVLIAAAVSVSAAGPDDHGVRFTPESGHVRCNIFKKVVRNAGAQRTGCEIAFADTAGRCAASAMAMPRPLAMQA